MLGLFFLAGCVHPGLGDAGEAVTEAGMPEQWVASPASGLPVETGWIDALGDPALGGLVEEALAANPSFGAALARLEAAGELARINRADRWPALNGTLNASRARTTAGTTLNTFTGSLGVSWELDYLGKVRDQARAAGADYVASAAEFEATRLSLAANVARGWFNLLEAEAQATLAEETLALFESNLEVIEAQYGSGLSTALDVRLLRANVASARATVATRRRARDATGRALEVLLGRYPRDAWGVTAELPESLAPAPVGVPSGLLVRRPDILAAEASLEAAQLRAGAARKALFPSLSLSGAVGRQSREFDGLLDGDNSIWNLAGGLTAPLFRGGELRAASRRQAALAQAALEAYRQTLLTAFREVESALAAEAYWVDQEEALVVSVTESLAAEEIAWERYQRGLIDIITVLEAQRRSLTARQSLLSVYNQRLQNRIDLNLALGGSFSAS